MAKLIYSAIMSLDGYIADEHGNFDWAEPDEEVHAFINNLERLVGRRRGGWIDPTDRGRAHVSRGLVSISGHRGDASPPRRRAAPARARGSTSTTPCRTARYANEPAPWRPALARLQGFLAGSGQ